MWVWIWLTEMLKHAHKCNSLMKGQWFTTKFKWKGINSIVKSGWNITKCDNVWSLKMSTKRWVHRFEMSCRMKRFCREGWVKLYLCKRTKIIYTEDWQPEFLIRWEDFTLRRNSLLKRETNEEWTFAPLWWDVEVILISIPDLAASVSCLSWMSSTLKTIRWLI